MDVMFYVCLWLDHYLHQHGRSGPMGSKWLGGVAIFTIVGDQYIEIVYCPSVIVVGCFHLVLWVLEYAFL